MSSNKLTLVLAVFCLLVPRLLVAAPQGATVVAGAANISQAGNTTTIIQSSSSAVINWQGFDTASNESVIFNQPNTNSTALNRINSGLPTNFAGSLTANGKVFMVNSAGIVFAGTSNINAASFIASTSDIKDQDFMNNKYNFFAHSRNESAGIINNGKITVKDSKDGVVSLVAPNVINNKTGVIQANMGRVVLASGKVFTLDFNQDNLINFDASVLTKNGHVANSGMINAEEGKVLMTSHAVSDVLNSVVNNADVIEAGEIKTGIDGQVYLLSQNSSITISGNITADRLTANASHGAVLETQSGGLAVHAVQTSSANGTDLFSENNKIRDFSAINTKSGDINLKNTNSLSIDGITQTGGNLTIVNTGYISQDSDFNARMLISGSTSFTQAGGGYYDWGINLLSRNEFTGPVSITSAKNVELTATYHNLILGKVNVDMGLYISSPQGNIIQVPNTKIIVKGRSWFAVYDDEIKLDNPGNQFTGDITLSNWELSNKNISLNNSIDTTINYIYSGGVIRVTSGGLMTNNGEIISHATNAPNGHSIILIAPNVYIDSEKLFPGSGGVNNPLGWNSYLIYTKNPDSAKLTHHPWFDYIFGSSVPKPDILWEQAYTPTSATTIPVGNYVIYSDESPVMIASHHHIKMAN